MNGLSETEVAARRERGQGNNVSFQSSRSYAEIIRANVFTFINLVLFGIGGVLVLLGLYSDAFASVGIAFWNTVIGIAQELRAKRALDKIALLTRPKATVIRDRQPVTVDPSQIVVGDILLVNAGDQIVVDGQVVSDGRMDADESLLTGESDLIAKRKGDKVYSGTYCVNGSAYYEAQMVGEHSVASKLTAGARAYRAQKTPLQVDVEFVVQLLVVLTMLIGILFGLAALVSSQALTESARMAAVIAGLIPNGLFFMTTIAYGMGSVRMAGQGALIQHANAVESMSNVNVLCLDKTGTLTANHINLVETTPYNITEDEFRRVLSIYAASASTGNRTSEALNAALKGEKQPIIEEVPFSSDRKWSAVSFDTADMKGVYVLGAPEMLREHLNANADLVGKFSQWEDDGLRVLLFAKHDATDSLYDQDEQPQLPNELTPLGALTFSDELRPEADVTLKAFTDTGIKLKIISGDNPNTVAALAKQAGIEGDIKVISGLELEPMTPAQFAEAAEHITVFGRITPQQKERLVGSLRASGYYVAMIGDGVNDVLSLKRAQIGIAMQSGSQATRGVADIILMNDSFAALPSAFSEGQRIVIGMLDIIRLFLSRVIYQSLIILAIAIIGLGFPITPVHQSLLSIITVGVPTLALAAWAHHGAPPKRSLRQVMRFVIPAGVSIGIIGTAIYVIYFVAAFTNSAGTNVFNVRSLTQEQVVALETMRGKTIIEIIDLAQQEALVAARTILTSVTTLAGLVLIVFVEPPTQYWTGGDEYSGDWRPTIMAILLAVAYMIIMLVPSLRSAFELAELQPRDWVIVIAVVGLWAMIQRFLWRQHVFDRLLRLA
ncbi:MAG: HAD-IC family P-type ATPase [Chloroflexi bacterium]|nr:HAD-IC family P-type ATPase [Chloroflexota bacterium]MCC6893728.1 HAD-IC family P-type ATPase [Anaerolineae bacterium]